MFTSVTPIPFNEDLLHVCHGPSAVRGPRRRSYFTAGHDNTSGATCAYAVSLDRLPVEGVSDAPDLEFNKRLYQQSAAEKVYLPSRDRAENQGCFLLILL